MADAQSAYGLIRDAANLVEGSRVAWEGRRSDHPSSAESAVSVDLGGATVTPALIDCHTYIVYGGDRSLEFKLRLQGVGYAEIAHRDGGIVSKMRYTREASDKELVRSGALLTSDPPSLEASR